MFIKSIRLQNFKCFSETELDFCIPDGEKLGSGLNIFVGENNGGKSSMMEAIYFLRNKGKKNVKKIGASDNSDFFVECDFTGNIEPAIEDFVQENKQEAFKNTIFNEGGINIFRARREFQEESNIKKILFFNQSDGQFSNRSGIDAPFQSFFQISNIWANTNPENESKFGSTTVCGNLLADISEKFKIDHQDQYDKFLGIFNDTFNSGTSGLQKDLNDVAAETEEILNEQFGKGKLKFKFDTPEPSTLFKNIKILVNDGEETELSEKGHGMQRAVILSLLQVYAKRITQLKDKTGNVKLKPHFLFIDEPEMGLHPQAQKKLFEALRVIAKTHQVFISTHSENFISTDQIKNVFRFYKNEKDDVKVKTLKNFTTDLKPFRKFFFHHHKLFFTNRAVFVEGADDIERYPHFCEKEGFIDLKKDFYFLSGCGDFKVFRELCNALDIKSFFLFDLDLIAKNQTTLKNYDAEIWRKIEALKKEVSKKDPSALFDKNLTTQEITQKNEIIQMLQDDYIFILKYGALEQYLNEEFNTKGDEERKDLCKIFNAII